MYFLYNTCNIVFIRLLARKSTQVGLFEAIYTTYIARFINTRNVNLQYSKMADDTFKTQYSQKSPMSGYTFLDNGFYDVAGTMHEALTEQGVKYALVGGAGVQAHLATRLTQNGEKSLKDCKHVLGVLLRPTCDFDIATLDGNVEKMFRVGQTIQSALGLGFDPKIQRTLKFEPRYAGQEPIFVQYQLSAEDFQGLPGMYDTVVESAEEVTLRLSGRNGITLRVAKPEYIVASKLTRGSHKDNMDIAHLLTVLKQTHGNFGFEDVRAILKGHNKEQLFSNLENICVDLGIARPELN